MNYHEKNLNVFFMDDACLLCHKSIQLLCRIDSRKKLHFSTLQGESAKNLPTECQLSSSDSNDARATESAVLIEDYQLDSQRIWHGADAVLRSLFLIGGWWRIFWLGYFIPQSIKQACYQFIARNRHSIVPTHKTCPLPTAETAERFIP